MVVLECIAPESENSGRPASPDHHETEETMESPSLASSQDIPASVINPLKLIALLRARFGVGQYEITFSVDGTQRVQHPNTQKAFDG
ncbi:hypothetical protein B0T19DRAFT_23097 [Cercophora scortea]|uniref:Uncharacterized protein n=1 Tax=Cercophora scortea TaxID=314031 RepID=A0AAE0J2T8_9PEZI|nr:hypothetical protein B0T19DRAFT_23097 [Cercophora scortea]